MMMVANQLQSLEDYWRLNFEIYTNVVQMLDTNEGWRKVISSLKNYRIPVTFSDYVLRAIEKSQSPSGALLLELQYRQCPYLMFCDVLRKVYLLDVLSLISDPEPLSIIKQPGDENETVYAVSGGELTLDCEAVGLPPPSYRWYFFNIDLPNQTEPVLHISEFTEANIGEYHCVVSHCIQGKEVSVISNTVIVEFIPEAPVFIKDLQPQEVTVPRYGSIILSVEVRARPPPIFEWMRNNKILDGQSSNKLKLKKVKEADEGSYSCFVKNQVGSTQSSPCKLTVYSSPNQVSAKMALLIANQDYEHLTKLTTPSSDVVCLAKILKKLGFQVFALHNLTLVEMRNACTWFYSLLPSNAYAIVYFGGHGFELASKFMMPVDSPLDSYCRKDCFCEEEVKQLGVKASPRLIVILLDMCLKVPSAENEKIHAEKTPVFEYELGGCEVIVGTATSSHQSAYEESKTKKGCYVEKLSKHLMKDMSILDILQKTHGEFKQSAIQKPGVSNNVSTIYKLTDEISHDKEYEKFVSEIKAITHLSQQLQLDFTKVKLKPVVLLRYHKGYFLNSVDLVFPLQLKDWIITADINSEELNCYSWWRETTGESVLTINNIQKAKTKVYITIKLNKSLNGCTHFVDYCEAELVCPILKQFLWFERKNELNNTT